LNHDLQQFHGSNRIPSRADESCQPTSYDSEYEHPSPIQQSLYNRYSYDSWSLSGFASSNGESTSYTPADRTDETLGLVHHYEQSRDDAMRHPAIQYLSSVPVESTHNPLHGPSLLDSACIDPQQLSLPIEHAGVENTDYSGHMRESKHCPQCDKVFTGHNALKNLKYALRVYSSLVYIS
jgi:hypothetical protein